MAISQIVQNSLSDTISLGPKITSVQVANSTYVVKDDTAINIGGGYIVITGSGFQSNCSVIVDSNIACSVAFVSATQVRAELPAKPAGTYNLYLLNGDGGTAIRVNALQYSNTPTWVTSSPLTDQPEDTNVSIQLSATGANTYVLQTGSTLPDGLTLSANGLISGFVNTNVAIDTTYNFTVEAIDTENQETPKAFAVTIIVADPFFNRTVLLLDGDGTSGANNNVFRDSSNNNFAITRNGNTTQGTFTPYSPAGWSNYFDGNGDSLSTASNTAFNFGTGSFTLECWFNKQGNGAYSDSVGNLLVYTGNGSFNAAWLGITDSGTIIGKIAFDGSWISEISGGSVGNGSWNHVALVRNGSAVNLYLNGTSIANTTNSTDLSTYGTNAAIGVNRGSSAVSDRAFNGYISNARIVKSAVYTSAFTPSTTPLTNITNTSLLTCQSNRFIDNSSNNFTITPNGNVKVTPFSPFAPTETYSAATHGGSGYFDGSGDYLVVGTSSSLGVGSQNFTHELWWYPTAWSSGAELFGAVASNGTQRCLTIYQYNNNGTLGHFAGTGSTDWNIVSNLNGGTAILNQWNHIAFTRNGTTFATFLNGVRIATTTASGTIGSANTGIGGGNLGSSLVPAGYIAGCRTIAGVALYTNSTYTIPTAPPTINDGGDTRILVNFTNAGILDYTTKSVIETVGDARINTAVTKYGTGSISFDGNADIIKISSEASSGLYSFGTGDFTIEFWIRFNAVNTEMSIMDFRSAAATIQIAIYMKNTGILGFYVNQADRIVAGSAFSANQWYHVAVARYQANTKMFIDGTQTGSTYADTNSYTNGAGRPWMGALSDGTGTLYLNALVDDVRITNGVARYTSNFTPPTGAHRKR